MIKLDNIIGDIVFISFANVERLQDIGISESSGHFLLKGYDQMGIWLEHPGIIIMRSEDKNGKPLPVSDHTKEKIAADFIVTWDNINTMMQYPEREGFDLPNELNKKIGFHFEQEEKEIE